LAASIGFGCSLAALAMVPKAAGERLRHLKAS
jgi:hypothetical protein